MSKNVTAPTVTRSIFGANIDRRCPGYSWFQKFLVVLGILGDFEKDARIAQADRDQEELEVRWIQRAQ